MGKHTLYRHTGWPGLTCYNWAVFRNQGCGTVLLHSTQGLDRYYIYLCIPVYFFIFISLFCGIKRDKVRLYVFIIYYSLTLSVFLPQKGYIPK